MGLEPHKELGAPRRVVRDPRRALNFDTHAAATRFSRGGSKEAVGRAIAKTVGVSEATVRRILRGAE
jgi:predicted transcriptional regulator